MVRAVRPVRPGGAPTSQGGAVARVVPGQLARAVRGERQIQDLAHLAASSGEASAGRLPAWVLWRQSWHSFSPAGRGETKMEQLQRTALKCATGRGRKRRATHGPRLSRRILVLCRRGGRPPLTWDRRRRTSITEKQEPRSGRHRRREECVMSNLTRNPMSTWLGCGYKDCSEGEPLHISACCCVHSL